VPMTSSEAMGTLRFDPPVDGGARSGGHRAI